MTQSTAIRRQAEVDTRVVSLGMLLTEIAADSTRLSRRRFVSMFSRDREQIGDAVFSRDFAGNVGEHIDPALVRADIDLLKTRAQPVVDYVSRHVAHVDRQPVRALPTFAELSSAIDAIGDVFRKYVLLLTASAYMDLVPTPQTPWETVFDVPWRQPPPDIR